MTSSGPTLIVGLYRVRPNRRDAWLETWQHLAAIARSRPECRTFNLEVDPANPTLCRVISRWSNDSAFDRFVREVGLPWIERHLDYSESPPHYVHLAFPGHAAQIAVETRLAGV